MSGSLDHLNRKTCQFHNLKIRKIDIRLQCIAAHVKCCQIDSWILQRLFFFGTCINWNIIFLFDFFCCKNMVKMTMCQKNCNRSALHFKNLLFDSVGIIARINDQHFFCFFIFQEVTIRKHTSNNTFL